VRLFVSEIISYDLETLLAEVGAEVPGPCPIVADALAGLTEPHYSMFLLGPGPSSWSLRASPSAEFGMLVAAVAGSGASPAR
jgi:hypothetical protein